MARYLAVASVWPLPGIPPGGDGSLMSAPGTSLGRVVWPTPDTASHVRPKPLSDIVHDPERGVVAIEVTRGGLIPPAHVDDLTMQRFGREPTWRPLLPPIANRPVTGCIFGQKPRP